MLPIYYSSTEPNAPTLNNAAGTLIALLDACLVNGFGLKSVTSITVAGGVATVTCTGHQFVGGVGVKVAIAGATPVELNGNQDVTVVNANTFTYPTTAASGSATGTITAKRPGLGWAKQFSGTNKAVYQRTDVAATAMVLRVDDTAAGVASATYARARMAESAADVDTLTGIAPLDTHLSGGVYVSRGVGDTTAKRWMLIGDGRTFWLFTDDNSYSFASYGGLHGFGFGDLNSWRSGGDYYGCLVWGNNSTNGANNSHFSGETPGLAEGIYISRPTNHVGGSTAATFRGRATSAYAGSGNNSHAPYPSPVDGGLAIETAVLVVERTPLGSSPFPMRGTMRGVAHPLGFTGAVLHGQVLSNLIGSSDSWLCIGVAAQGSAGMLLFNISSAW